MLNLILKSKKEWEMSKLALELGKAIGKPINTNTFSMAEDLKIRNGSLFEVKKDIFENKPLNIKFKWSRK